MAKKFNYLFKNKTTVFNSVLNYVDLTVSMEQSKGFTIVSELSESDHDPQANQVDSDESSSEATSNNSYSLKLDVNGPVIFKLLTKPDDPVHRKYMPLSIELSQYQMEVLESSGIISYPTPYSETVCGILQNYINEFPNIFHMLATTTEDQEVNEFADKYEQIDRSQELVYEFCIGIRNMFDVYFSTLLVTASEQQPYKPDEINGLLHISYYDPFPKKFSIYPNRFYTNIEEIPTYYCAVYGYPHLLRLLYLLPRKILPNMEIPSICHKVVLYRQLSFFIQFLDMAFGKYDERDSD